MRLCRRNNQRSVWFRAAWTAVWIGFPLSSFAPNDPPSLPTAQGILAERIELGGISYVRLIVPAGTFYGKQKEILDAWKLAAFNFALDSYVPRLFPDRETAWAFLGEEAPTSNSAYAIFARVERGSDGRLRIGQIDATMRTDYRDHPGLHRINGLIRKHNRAHPGSQQRALSLEALESDLVKGPHRLGPRVEFKNFIVRTPEQGGPPTSVPLAGLLLDLATGYLSKDCPFGFMETDFGARSEMYRSSIGFRYLRVYSERTGLEFEVPPGIREESASMRERGTWRREINPEGKQLEYVAVLGITRENLQYANKKVRERYQLHTFDSAFQPVVLEGQFMLLPPAPSVSQMPSMDCNQGFRRVGGQN
jgi:hypothetical protein